MCGKLFHSLGSAHCTECNDEMDRRFIKVRDYIYAHPEASVAEIVEKTGVPQKNILSFLREERLVLEHASGILVCERCAKPIAGGRFCDECKNQLLKAFAPAGGAQRSREPEPEPEKAQKPESGRKNDKQGMIYSRYRH